MRLSLGRDFLAVRREGIRANAGPLLVHGRANDVGVTRLGLSISRRVGGAVIRNALKRRLREAFRFAQHELPGVGAAKPRAADGARSEATDRWGYDLLISARAHEPLRVEAYQRLLLEAVSDIDRTWRKKLQRRTDRSPPTLPSSPPTSPPSSSA